MRRELRQSDSIEIIILNNYRSIVIPECGQISPGLQNDVDREDEAEQNICDQQLSEVPHQLWAFPGKHVEEKHGVVDHHEDELEQEHKADNLSV